MPIRGVNHSSKVSDGVPFFQSLSELDQWAATPNQRKVGGVLPYTPRTSSLSYAPTGGRLLLCHDYKGGYTESPTAPSYTFNFWGYCDTFIYFSHHRITIPPSGWSTASHRHGVKMLGTIIFEHEESESDCLQLLVGALPRSKHGPARTGTASTTLPVSPHYARLLADLAYQRGFDGYLLNFEAVLRGRVEQTRALTVWIALLEQELKRKIGDHAELIWYDSVIVDGRLAWQDRLNSINVPFFLPSTGFFSNYTWPVTHPARTASYLLSLDQSSVSRPKSLKDIYMGVDVWGRGSHGGGGFGLYKALSHIDPQSLGLSVALFGQGWTWESEENKPKWSWKSWWEYDLKLWLGPRERGEEVPVPPLELREGEPPCDPEHGPFQPIADFFQWQPPPNPARLPFFTTFSPGVGWSWFVRGARVFHSETGWTDVDKTTSIGDLAFPRPSLSWEDDEGEGTLPEATSDLSMDDAWLGGSSLLITISAPPADGAFYNVWLPIQSLVITPRRSYRLSIVYKVSGDVEPNVEASIKPLASHPDVIHSKFDVHAVPPNSHADQQASTTLHHDWTELTIDFTLLPSDVDSDVLSAAGLSIAFISEDPTNPAQFTLSVGSLSVSANPLPHPANTTLTPRLLWADFVSTAVAKSADTTPVPAPVPVSTSEPTPAPARRPPPFAGTLTWGTGFSLGPVPPLTITSLEDPQPAWVVEHVTPGFAYFNIYVLAHRGEGVSLSPEDATFVGTTGLDGRENRFYVDAACVPPELSGAKAARFYIQGVTDRGRVLDWEDCVFIDVDA